MSLKVASLLLAMSSPRNLCVLCDPMSGSETSIRPFPALLEVPRIYDSAQKHRGRLALSTVALEGDPRDVTFRNEITLQASDYAAGRLGYTNALVDFILKHYKSTNGETTVYWMLVMNQRLRLETCTALRRSLWRSS
jgi:hypothetical protein